MLSLSVSGIISRVITLIIAFTAHEFSHAYVADRFGDDTPRLHGRLTLNPIKHLDVIGSLMLIIMGFGWAKPVPVNPTKLRQHSRSAFMWVSLAGPLSNLLMALLAVIPLRLKLFTLTTSDSFLPSPAEFLLTFILINILLLVFNLIPVAPLDGEKVLEFLLPQQWSNQYAKFKPYGPIVLLVLVFILPRFGVNLLGWIMNPIIYGLQSFILGA
jgi:Zn-dependent protease